MIFKCRKWLSIKIMYHNSGIINEQLNTYQLKSRISGNSQKPLYDTFRSYYNKEIDHVNIPGITIVNSKIHAEKVVQILEQHADRIHAWDTETVDVNVKIESPIGKGKIICSSIFCGPDIDFGNGPRVFIDNFAQNSDNIMVFKRYLENKNYLKVWHNYSFDRHIFYNHGIDVQGFGGDTMHLARLLDPSLLPNEYSLSKQTMIHDSSIKSIKEQFLQNWDKDPSTTDEQRRVLKIYRENLMDINIKRSLTDIFGVMRGEGQKTKVFPSIIKMHCSPDTIKDWIQYSSLDAEVTFFLYYTLVNQLRRLPTVWGNIGIANDFKLKTQLDIYKNQWLPFGELLTDMERRGFCVDVEHAKSMKQKAEQDILKLEQDFIQWVASIQPTDQSRFNCSSLVQLQQLFYGPWERVQSSDLALKKQLTNDQEDQSSLIDDIIGQEDSQNSIQYDSDGRKRPVRKEILKFPLTKEFKIPNLSYEKGNGQLRQEILCITGLGIKPMQFTMSGLPSCDTSALKQLVGKKQNDGTYDGQLFITLHQGQQENLSKALNACDAVIKLIELRGLEVLLGTFITPLVEMIDRDKSTRINCSMNINTETGRLSSKNPNMQNQPALEKDKYFIRKSFIASKGMKLIVADYGQLELRVLAHMTNCKAMIDAFNLGGDFHSRTAMSMFPNIRQEVEKGEVLLEWDKSKGEAPVPLLKDKYAAERRKAKTMNFSIAYGKTQTGFAKEWNISGKEAQKIIDLWYAERQEVKDWQRQTKDKAFGYGYTQTLIGRYRRMTKYFKNGVQDRYYWHGLRASINTPIQGGAADIVIASMVRIAQDQRLRELGWGLILQVHDELILEGPQESAQEALNIVRDRMENPFGEDMKLRIKLEVDAKIGNNWYECK